MSDPTSSTASAPSPFRRLVQTLRRKRNDEAIRETLEELIEESSDEPEGSEAASERQLLTNILKLHGRKVGDVMVPRADIVALDAESSLDACMALISREGHSRYPVYNADLDDVIGMIHIKDILPFLTRSAEFNLRQVVRDIVIIAPSMPVLDLLVEMRQSHRHMALVVDEFGGIDGLVTIEDLVEEIVGEIEDEHDETGQPQVTLKSDGSLVADGRLLLGELESHTGRLLDDDVRNDVDTLGGLLFFIAGRVPSRGELIKHDNGVEFEVIEADSRRVKRVRIRNLPASAEDEG